MLSLTYLRLPLFPVHLVLARTRSTLRIQNRNQLQSEFKLYLDSAAKDDTQLIRCIKSCASLHSEAPNQRIQLADNMIEQIKRINVVPSLQVKNTLLQVYLKNRHKFSPSSFLQQMKEDSISPSAGTLYLLLLAYCRQGNMEGANAILEEMINNGLTINEDIYASLIMCSSVNADMEGAKDIIHTMKQNGLTPTETAYSALLSGYAYHGDFESIRKMIDEMKSEHFYVSHDMYIDMLDALSLGGKSEKMRELLDMVHNKTWMYNELLNKMELFASHGDLVGTSAILETLLDIDSELLTDSYDETFLEVRGARSFRLLMLRQDKLQLSDLLSSIDLFERAGISNLRLYELLLKVSIDTKNWTNLRTILTNMAAEGLSIKKLYIYPGMAASGRRKDRKGLEEWIHFIKQHDITFDITMFSFYKKAFKEDFMTFFNLIFDKGYVDDPDLLCSIVKTLCTDGTASGIQHFTQFLNDYIRPDTLPVCNLINSVRMCFNETPSPDPVLVSTMMSGLSTLCATKVDANCYFGAIRSILKRIVFYKEKFPKGLLKTFLNIDDEMIDDNTLDQVMKLCFLENCPFKFNRTVELLKSCGVESECVQYEIINKVGHKAWEFSLLMSSFKAMIRHGCSVSSSVHDAVISTLVRMEKTGQSLIVYEEMKKKMTTPLSVATYTSFINLLVSTCHDSTAENVRSDMEMRSVPLNIQIFNNFIKLYGMKGNVSKAQEQFKMLKKLELRPTIRTYYQLMEGYCYHGDVAGVKSILEEARSTVGIDSTLLAQVLKSYIASADYDGGVLYLSESSDGCRVGLPSCLSLMNSCEVARRRDLTVQTMSYLSSIGTKQSDIDFSFLLALLMSDQYDDAVDLLTCKKDKTLKLKTLNYCTETLSTDGKVAPIKAIIKLANEFKMDTSSMYKSLILALASKRDIRGIVAVKEEIESLGIKPDPSLYKLMDTLITRCKKLIKYEEALRSMEH